MESLKNLELYGLKSLFKFKPLKSGDNKLYDNDSGKKMIFDNNDLLKKSSIIKIDFTTSNAFILFSDGELYSKGKGDALGRKSYLNEEKKQMQEVIFTYNLGKKIIINDMSCGYNHVLALTNDNQVYGWGENKYHQVTPRKSEKFIELPIIVNITPYMKIFLLIAEKNSSFAIGENNKIISWGEINKKGFSINGTKESDNSNEFVKHDDVTKLLSESIFKDTSNYTDAFITSRKLLYSKYNIQYNENEENKNKINNLIEQRKKLKDEYDKRKKENENSAYNEYKSNDKRIVSLQELIKKLDMKMTKFSKVKDKLRKEVSRMDEEITEQNSDIFKNNKLIEVVENDIENKYNEIFQIFENNEDKIDNQLNNKKNDEKFENISPNSSGEVKKKKAKKRFSSLDQFENESENKDELLEIQKQIKNKEIFKESLNKNLEFISSSLEMKEYERNKLLQEIDKVTEKENKILKGRYILDDIIHLYKESRMRKNNIDLSNLDNQNNKKNGIIIQKVNEVYSELMKLNKILDKNSINYLNTYKPYSTLDDLLLESNKELIVVKDFLENINTQQGETIKNELKIIFELINEKINLMEQQNKMIKIIYTLLNNLNESDVKNYVQEKETNEEVTDNNDPNTLIMDEYKKEKYYIYKNIIINLLKETYWFIEQEDQIVIRNDDIPAKEIKDYFKENENKKKIINERNPNIPINNENFELYKYCSSYDYQNNIIPPEKNNKSTYNWNFDLGKREIDIEKENKEKKERIKKEREEKKNKLKEMKQKEEEEELALKKYEEEEMKKVYLEAKTRRLQTKGK